MPRIEKSIMYAEIKKRLNNATVFFTSYDRLSVHELETLRKELHENSGRCFLAKKTLVKKYFAEQNVKIDDTVMTGPVFIATATDNFQKVSKTLVKFEKENNKFQIKGVYFEGAVQDKKYVAALSNLPSREELIATVLRSMQAPVSNFVLTLNAVLKSFVVVVNEIQKKKQDVT